MIYNKSTYHHIIRVTKAKLCQVDRNIFPSICFPDFPFELVSNLRNGGILLNTAQIQLQQEH